MKHAQMSALSEKSKLTITKAHIRHSFLPCRFCKYFNVGEKAAKHLILQSCINNNFGSLFKSFALLYDVLIKLYSAT